MRRLRAIWVGLLLVAETVVVLAVGVVPASAHCYNTGCDYQYPPGGCSDWQIAPISDAQAAILLSNGTQVGYVILEFSTSCGAAYAEVELNGDYLPPSGYCGTDDLIARTSGNIRAVTEGGTRLCGPNEQGNGAMLGDANFNQAAQACYQPWFGQPWTCTGQY